MNMDAANAYRIAFEEHWISVRDVEVWADRAVAEAEAPEDWLLDISYAATLGASETLSALNAIPKDVDYRASWPTLRQLMLAALGSGNAGLSGLLSFLESMARCDELPEADASAVRRLVLDYEWRYENFVKWDESDEERVKQSLRCLLKGESDSDGAPHLSLAGPQSSTGT